jgi:MFS family permease
MNEKRSTSVLPPPERGVTHELGPPHVARVQRRTLLVLVVTQLLGGAGVSTGVAIAALSAARLSGSDVVGGLAATCTVLGAALAAGPIARIAARAGRRLALLAGYLTATVGAVAAAAAVGSGSWPLLLAASVPFGAATATSLAARFAATDLASPDRRARALGAVLWATTAGVVAGPNLAAPAHHAAEVMGLAADTGPYLLCAALFGPAALGILVGLRPDPLRLSRRLDAVTVVPERPVAHRRWSPRARLALAAVAAAQLVMTAVMSMAPVHLTHGGAGLQVVGLVISIHAAGMYALSPLFGWLSDRRGRLPVLALGAGLLALAGVMTGTAGAHDVPQLSAGLVLLGLGWSATLVSGSALLVDAVPVADRPGVQGRADAVVNLGGAIGGSVAGVVVAATSYGVLGTGAAIVAVVVLVAVLRCSSRWGPP